MERYPFGVSKKFEPIAVYSEFPRENIGRRSDRDFLKKTGPPPSLRRKVLELKLSPRDHALESHSKESTLKFRVESQDGKLEGKVINKDGRERFFINGRNVSRQEFSRYFSV